MDEKYVFLHNAIEKLKGCKLCPQKHVRSVKKQKLIEYHIM